MRRLSTLLTIIAGTLASEDLTCIVVGLLIRQRELPWSLGLAGCYLGILLGDLSLWLVGRAAGATAMQWPALRRRLPSDDMSRLAEWLDRRGGYAVLAARFMPGARFPVYVAAGVLGRRATRFLGWAALAGLLWTPLLVGAVATLGDVVAGPLRRVVGAGWLSSAAALAAIYLLARLAAWLSRSRRAVRLSVAVQRLWRWEFWPPWVFYAPLAPWILWLAVRYRGLTTPTAVNPALPHGGIVGESKHQILSMLPAEWVLPFELIPPGEPLDRCTQLRARAERRGWSLPLILKPDAGQRGVGVRRLERWSDAESYFFRNRDPVLAQVYHPGPFEAGILYVRHPADDRGRIFSVTDKVFPAVVGDGRTSVADLVWRHPRYRMQAARFLERLDGRAGLVPEAGARVALALAGNHCQGTLFRDGAALVTPQLESRIDEIARQVPGLHFGRFDVRYSNRDRFLDGQDLAIVELNGATSESTNIYDPDWSLIRAYGVLFRQWRTLYEVGAAQRRCGATVTPVGTLIREIVRHYARRRVDPIAD